LVHQKNTEKEAGMEALQGKNMPSPDKVHSTETNNVEEFEDKLREENMRLLRNLRLKEMLTKAKSNDPAMWPFK
jgi:hypothetical protein